jgi:hypothetical protein
MESEQTQPLQSPSRPIIAPSPALSQTSTVFDSTPHPPRQRATFARLASVDDGQYTVIKNHEDDITDASPYNDDHDSSTAHGLGIHVDRNAGASTDDLKKDFGVDEHELRMGSPKSARKASAYSSQSSFPQSTAYEPDIQRLRNRRSFAESLKAVYDGEFSEILLVVCKRMAYTKLTGDNRFWTNRLLCCSPTFSSQPWKLAFDNDTGSSGLLNYHVWYLSHLGSARTTVQLDPERWRHDALHCGPTHSFLCQND